MATPRDLTAPVAPTGLSAEAADSMAKLSWNANSEPDLHGYRMYVDGALRAEYGPDVLSADVADLTNGQEYTFTLTAVDAVGNESDHSAAALATPRDLTPPTSPSSLQAVATLTSVQLSWVAPTDADLAGHNVYRDGTLVATLPLDANKYWAGGLATGTTYTFTVTAFDEAGNESLSVSVDATPVRAQVVFDDFNRPDGALGVTPVGGVPWQRLSGRAWEVAGETAWAPDSGDTFGMAVADVGIADGLVSVRLMRFDWGQSPGLVVRAVSADSHIRVTYGRINKGCDGIEVRAPQRMADGSVRYPIFETVCRQAAVGDMLAVSLSGSTIKVLHNGVEVIVADSTYNMDATRHGIWGRDEARLDDFEVIGLDNGVAPAVPARVSARSTSVDEVTVSWAAVGDSDVDVYRVYDGEMLIGSVDRAATSYVIAGVSDGQQLDLTVTAVDRYGNESLPSILVRMTVGQVLFDDFNRPAGALGFTPVGGVPWQPSGGWKVVDEVAEAANSNNFSVALADSGIADGWCRCGCCGSVRCRRLV